MQSNILIFALQNPASKSEADRMVAELKEALPEFRIVVIDQCSSVTYVKVEEKE